MRCTHCQSYDGKTSNNYLLDKKLQRRYACVMQTLQVTNEDNVETSTAVVDTVLKAMFLLRSEWRKQKPADITMTQFRALGYILINPGVSLSELKDALDLTASSASRILDVLVRRNLVFHQVCEDDRRRARLDVTKDGREVFRYANARATDYMWSVLANRAPEEMALIHSAMILLKDSLEFVKENTPSRSDFTRCLDNGQ